jgi:hypothetical protein
MFQNVKSQHLLGKNKKHKRTWWMEFHKTLTYTVHRSSLNEQPCGLSEEIRKSKMEARNYKNHTAIGGRCARDLRGKSVCGGQFEGKKKPPFVRFKPITNSPIKQGGPRFP